MCCSEGESIVMVGDVWLVLLVAMVATVVMSLVVVPLLVLLLLVSGEGDDGVGSVGLRERLDRVFSPAWMLVST
jgi:hypothetical protein